MEIYAEVVDWICWISIYTTIVWTQRYCAQTTRQKVAELVEVKADARAIILQMKALRVLDTVFLILGVLLAMRIYLRVMHGI